MFSSLTAYINLSSAFYNFFKRAFLAILSFSWNALAATASLGAFLATSSSIDLRSAFDCIVRVNIVTSKS